MTVMVAKTATQQLHAHAYRHLGLYAYRVELLQEYVTWEMGTFGKAGKPRAIACAWKMDIVLPLQLQKPIYHQV